MKTVVYPAIDRVYLETLDTEYGRELLAQHLAAAAFGARNMDSEVRAFWLCALDRLNRQVGRERALVSAAYLTAWLASLALVARDEIEARARAVLAECQTECLPLDVGGAMPHAARSAASACP